MVGILIMCPLGDRCGRKRILIASTILSGVATHACTRALLAASEGDAPRQ